MYYVQHVNSAPHQAEMFYSFGEAVEYVLCYDVKSGWIEEHQDVVGDVQYRPCVRKHDDRVVNLSALNGYNLEEVRRNIVQSNSALSFYSRRQFHEMLVEYVADNLVMTLGLSDDGNQQAQVKEFLENLEFNQLKTSAEIYYYSHK